MSQVAKSIFVFFARAAVIALIGFLLYQSGYNEAVRDTVRDYPDSKAMQRTARTQARSQEIRSECVPELHTEEVLRNTQVFRTNERGNR